MIEGMFVPEQADSDSEKDIQSSHEAIAASDQTIIKMLEKMEQTPQNIHLAESIKADLIYRESMTSKTQEKI